jgi:uncharacterized protein (TIGR02266 family)
MTDVHNGLGGQTTGGDDLVEIDLNFESMRRFQAEFSPNLSKGGLFIDTGEPLSPGSVVRFRVILPEEFVFLEGTSVVEWIRSADAICDGAPGMALRFVTLSSQNQELVEQLVQDYVDTGGTPFDLDVRPVPADFPTDSLEGAPPPPSDVVDEGYKLTLRHTGPGLQADALRALAEAMPNDDEEDPQTGTEDQETEDQETLETVESEDGVSAEPDEVDGIEIVSNAAAEVVPDVEETVTEVEAVSAVEEAVDDVEAIGDPPEFDWSAELDTSSEPVEFTPAEETVVAGQSEVELQDEPEEILVAEQDELSFPDEVSPAEETAAIPDVLPPPPAFDDGPEVIDDVGDSDLGSPAFDVSIPEHDDEPDTTPVLPDEGRDVVTVTPEFGFEDEPPRRRRWPLALAALFVLAVGGGFLWPHAKDWLASREDAPTQESATAEGAQVAEESQSPVGEQAPADPAEVPQSADVVVDEARSGDDGEAVVVETDKPEAAIEAVVERVEPEPAQAVVQLGSADSVTEIDVERGQSGTVIRIRANGSLEDGVLSMETLSSPPRVLVRVRGITNSFRPYTIEAMTPEVSQIRSGLHEERRPSELWIVIDLVEADVAVGGVSIGRDLAELVLSRP